MLCAAPDVGYGPYLPDVVDTIVRLAGIGKRDVVYDIGWGDAGVAIAAARTGARGVGFPLCALGHAVAARTSKASGVAGVVRLVNDDFYDTDFSTATVVVLYLLPSMNEKLLTRLTRELAGSRIVSAQFTFGSCYPPEKTVPIRSATPIKQLLLLDRTCKEHLRRGKILSPDGGTQQRNRTCCRPQPTRQHVFQGPAGGAFHWSDSSNQNTPTRHRCGTDRHLIASAITAPN